MVAISFLCGVGVVAGLAWFKLLRPFAKVLELSDEVNEEAPARVIAFPGPPAGETPDLLPLMAALNVNRGASAPAARPAAAEVAPAPALEKRGGLS